MQITHFMYFHRFSSKFSSITWQSKANFKAGNGEPVRAIYFHE